MISLQSTLRRLWLSHFHLLFTFKHRSIPGAALWLGCPWEEDTDVTKISMQEVYASQSKIHGEGKIKQFQLFPPVPFEE